MNIHTQEWLAGCIAKARLQYPNAKSISAITCLECNGMGRECAAGCSAHPDNWSNCTVCRGEGTVMKITFNPEPDTLVPVAEDEAPTPALLALMRGDGPNTDEAVMQVHPASTPEEAAEDEEDRKLTFVRSNTKVGESISLEEMEAKFDIPTTIKALAGVHWHGQRSGHFYVTLFDYRESKAAELAQMHLQVEGSLPDYSPGAYQHEPVACLELGVDSKRPNEHEGRPIIYVHSKQATQVGAD